MEDIFTDVNFVEHNRIFNQYAAVTQVNSYQEDKWEDKTPVEQNGAINARRYVRW